MTMLHWRFSYAVTADAASKISGTMPEVLISSEPDTYGLTFPPDAASPSGRIGASASLLAPARIAETLEQVISAQASTELPRRLPSNCNPGLDPANGENVQNWKNGETKSLVADVLPGPVKQYLSDARKTLEAETQRLYALLRWHTNADGSHAPFSNPQFEVSHDGHVWVLAPSLAPNAPLDLHIVRPIDLGTFNWDVFAQFAQMGEREPTGHSLLREARLIAASAPRSAVVIGAASVETAVKQAAIRLVPDSAYLLDNLPSPPIVKLITYVGSLSSPSPNASRLLPPTKEILKAIGWLVDTRNQLVHSRNASPNYFELSPALLLARDLLWILDAISGFEWAIEYISPSTRAKLLG